jgi:hypothetical protein
MRRSRLYVVAAALVISLSGGITMLAAAPAATANTGGNSFMYYPDINTTHQWCLGINSTHNGVLNPCTFINDQAWFRGGENGTSGFYQYKNGYGQCLGIAGGSTSNGARVVGTTCGGTTHPDQYWSIDYLNSQTYLCYVFNYKSGYLMQPASNTLHAAVEQKPWVGHSTSAQEWVFEINS